MCEEKLDKTNTHYSNMWNLPMFMVLLSSSLYRDINVGGEFESVLSVYIHEFRTLYLSSGF